MYLHDDKYNFDHIWNDVSKKCIQTNHISAVVSIVLSSPISLHAYLGNTDGYPTFFRLTGTGCMQPASRVMEAHKTTTKEISTVCFETDTPLVGLLTHNNVP